ncbi:hypothetical protein [Hyalangium gracile]|uniref:hypothetical protein n=1 Tax=Hyalangium gracile TaxID=394092 RepID=UPI001CCB4A08|nr:hypothetical protein [Hyalangium gracile]
MSLSWGGSTHCVGKRAAWAVGLLGITLLGSACGGSSLSDEAEGLGSMCDAVLPEESSLGQHTQALEDPNGLATNGLATNGLATNGLATNGLATNGAFATWLNADPQVRAELMKYIVACAVPAGETRTFSIPGTGVTHTWYGQVGLAPGWASGQAATELEEQLVSACLAAHANPYGLHVNFSLLGRDALGAEIPYTAQELSDYGVREACFFGNLFRNEGLYAGNDRNMLACDESSVRGCGLSRTQIGTNPECEPILRVGACEHHHCTLDASGLYYSECTYNGVRYRPVTTRIQPAALHVCGDGICQATEHCGQGAGVARRPDNCGIDCGPCR